jgi:DNA polymerase IV
LRRTVEVEQDETRQRWELDAGAATRSAGEVIVGGRPIAAADLDGLRVLHADMDAFYASVEARRDPRLAGRPLLVAGVGPRGVVSSASYEARAHGCRNAMPTAMARRLCPDAVVLPPDFDAYRAASADVMGIFRAVTPLVEPLSLDEAFLDVTGARRLFGDAVTIARSLRRRVRDETGLPVTVGVAANKFLAKLASTRGKPDGLLVLPPGRAVEWLHGLPVEALWGVGAATLDKLHRYGLRTVGELAGARPATLERVLGRKLGAGLLELAWGRDPRPVVPSEPAKSVGAEETFATDLTDREQLAREILRCCVRVGRRLRAAGLTGRTVTLKVRFADFTTITRSRTLAGPTDVDAELREVAVALFDGAVPEGAAIRLVGVAASGLAGADAPRQLAIDDDGRPGWRAADRAADAVRARFGERAVQQAALLDDDPTASPHGRRRPGDDREHRPG